MSNSNKQEKQELQNLIDNDASFKEALELNEDDEEQIDFSVNIPNDPGFDDMIYLALKAYKNQMDDIIHIPPKSRSRYLEVAQQYLNIAATALKNKKDHEFKVEQERTKHTPDGGQSSEESGGFDRRSLLEELNQKNHKKGTG